MKRLYQGLMVVATAALMACSSMDVNDAEALAENYPADFDAGVYLELHPVLFNLQLLNFVKDENARLKSSMDADAYAALVASDSLAFVADTASVHKFYVSPKYAAFTEAEWAGLWVEKRDTTIKKVTVTKVKQVTLDSLDAEGKKLGSLVVYVDSLILDSAGNATAVLGKLDTAATEVTQIDIDNVTLSINSNGTKRDSVTKDSAVVNVTPPGLDASVTKYVLPYNMYGVPNDLDSLEKIPGDTEAAARQFVAFGKSHGWAYRRCNLAELANPEAGVVVYPATKLYCDDNGVAREILK